MHPEHLSLQREVHLAPYTTLGLGGPARWWAQPRELQQLLACLEWAEEVQVPVWLLGGGSNVVIADQGLDGLVVQLQMQAKELLEDDGQQVRVRVEAGHDWDALVAWSVEQGLAGLECLSGIPGNVGAAPIQNIGAYGQELVHSFVEAAILDRSTMEIERWSKARCQFAYRDSALKRAESGRYVVLEVVLELRRGGAPTLLYPELQRAVGEEEPSLQRTREVVLELRRRKSMVLDASDPNSRSAGSFFTNPIVAPEAADEAFERLAPKLPQGTTMPRFDAGGGKVKLAAAWLIERCGFAKGCGIGRVGLSQKHTLALINRGGATAHELLGFAHLIQLHVEQTCGIRLHQEPMLLGFPEASLGAFPAPSFSAIR